MTIDTKALRALLAGLTPGTWLYDDDEGKLAVDNPGEARQYYYPQFAPRGHPDTDLIVAAANALPALLDALDAAEAREAGLRADAKRILVAIGPHIALCWREHLEEMADDRVCFGLRDEALRGKENNDE